MNSLLFNAFNVMGSEWVMWLLMMLSVVSLAIIFERFSCLRKQDKAGKQLWEQQISGWMKSGSVTALNTTALVKDFPCVESELLEMLVQKSQSGQKPKEDLKLLMSSFLVQKKLELDKNLSFLGTLGSNAPFVGLFGTVLGIIKAFHDIGKGAAENGVQNVSSGLSEALVATAVGLLVAIPAVFFFNLFQRKIKTVIARAESVGNFVIGSR